MLVPQERQTLALLGKVELDGTNPVLAHFVHYACTTGKTDTHAAPNYVLTKSRTKGKETGSGARRCPHDYSQFL